MKKQESNQYRCRMCGGTGGRKTHAAQYAAGQPKYQTDWICEWCFEAEERRERAGE